MLRSCVGESREATGACAGGDGAGRGFEPCSLRGRRLRSTSRTRTTWKLPTNDLKVVELGREKYAQRCAFCHGGGGKGGKGPCLSCGKFSYTGNTNAEIYATIAGGINNRSLGGTMGAFGTTMSQEEILSVITFLRWEEKRRIAAGEIPDPRRTQN